MGININYVKLHTETDFFVQPRIRQKVAKLLLALLKIRKVENYPYHAREFVGLFKKQIKRIDRLKEEEEKKLAIYLSEIEKVVLAIGEMSEEEVIETKKYLEGLIPKQKDTLEDHICNELLLNSVECFNPDEFQSENKKIDMINMLISNIGNKENFKFYMPDHIFIPGINEVITKYYVARGYTMREKMFNNIVVEKKDTSEKLWIPVVNLKKAITVSVLVLS